MEYTLDRLRVMYGMCTVICHAVCRCGRRTTHVRGCGDLCVNLFQCRTATKTSSRLVVIQPQATVVIPCSALYALRIQCRNTVDISRHEDLLSSSLLRRRLLLLLVGVNPQGTCTHCNTTMDPVVINLFTAGPEARVPGSYIVVYHEDLVDDTAAEAAAWGAATNDDAVAVTGVYDFTTIQIPSFSFH